MLVILFVSFDSALAQTSKMPAVSLNIEPRIINKYYDITPEPTVISEPTVINLTINGFGQHKKQVSPIDVVFSIDESGSMVDNDPKDLRYLAVQAFIEDLNSTSDQAGIVGWNDIAYYQFLPTSNFSQLKSRLHGIMDLSKDELERNSSGIGGSDINLGLNEATSMLEQAATDSDSPSNKLVIFISDGDGPYTQAGYVGSPADEASSKGYRIFSIGLNTTTGGKGEKILKDIASSTEGLYFSSPTPENLGSIFKNIVHRIHQSEIPQKINITEVLQPFVRLNKSSLSTMPDLLSKNRTGQTILKWSDVSRRVGNRDGELDANETFSVSFKTQMSKVGSKLPIIDHERSFIDYMDLAGKQTVDVPEIYIETIPTDTLKLKGNRSSSLALDNKNYMTVSSPSSRALNITQIAEPQQVGSSLLNVNGSECSDKILSNVADDEVSVELVVKGYGNQEEEGTPLNIVGEPTHFHLEGVTQDYVAINKSSFTIRPFNISYVNGKTDMEWGEISSYAGDRDSGLGENEILFVKFSVGIPRQVNTNISLPVFVEGQTKLIYTDIDGSIKTYYIPTPFIDIISRHCSTLGREEQQQQQLQSLDTTTKIESDTKIDKQCKNMEITGQCSTSSSEGTSEIEPENQQNKDLQCKSLEITGQCTTNLEDNSAHELDEDGNREYQGGETLFGSP